MHKDINPSNIVFNPKTGEAKIIDFGLSTVLPRENIARVNLNVLEGTLAYISPEQTGPDQPPCGLPHGFLFAGCDVLRCLTGRRPFDEADPLALLAQSPARNSRSRLTRSIRSIPVAAFSNIVMKLLAKNAEERYHSAYGLKADLLECDRQWRAKRSIADFPLGQTIFRTAIRSRKHYSGGKGKLRYPARRFAGKSRRARMRYPVDFRDEPAWANPASSMNCRSRWRAKRYFHQRQICAVAKPGAVFRIDRSPAACSSSRCLRRAKRIWRAGAGHSERSGGELAHHRGHDPRSGFWCWVNSCRSSAFGEEEQNRFNITLQNFIRAFMSEAHPLVLFLDDMQWADAASIAFLQRLAGRRPIFIMRC